MPMFSAKCDSPVRLDGITAIVTGCDGGIGLETVRNLYKRGARVIMACRNTTKAAEAKSNIEQSCKDTYERVNCGKLVIRKLDLASLKSVQQFAERLLREEYEVNILVNNAGVGIGPLRRTEDGFENAFGVNHLGHFALTLRLLPRIIESAPARIITVSSVMHTWTTTNFGDLNFHKRFYKPSTAYSQSKLANAIFSKELSYKLKENGVEGVNTYCVHPGVVCSNIMRNFDSVIFPGSHWLFKNTLGWFWKTPDQGAQTTIFCAVDDSCADETGLYYEECAVAKPNPEVNDRSIGDRLWMSSLKLVKLEKIDHFKTS